VGKMWTFETEQKNSCHLVINTGFDLNAHMHNSSLVCADSRFLNTCCKFVNTKSW